QAIAAGVQDAVDEQAGQRGALVWCQYHHGVGVAGVECDLRSAICVSHVLLPFPSDLLFEDLSQKPLRGRRGKAGLCPGAERRSLAAAGSKGHRLLSLYRILLLRFAGWYVSDARYYETLPHRMRLTVCRFARYRASGMQIICGLVSLQEINDQPNTGTRRPRTLARSV